MTMDHEMTEVLRVEGRAVLLTVSRRGGTYGCGEYQWEVQSTLPGTKWWPLDSGYEYSAADVLEMAGKAVSKAEQDAEEKGLVEA